MATARVSCCQALFFLFTVAACAQMPEPILANQNRTPAGKLENGILTLHLEIRQGAWRPEADDGPQLFVQAFGEAGKPAQIPGPLIRMPQGTMVHVSVKNTLAKKATLYGLNTRPGDPKAGIELAPGEARELSFEPGTPGTYYYWARTTEFFKAGPITLEEPVLEDAQLNGAFIVDPPGSVPPDRIFVVNLMFGLEDILHDAFEIVSLNGKSYPYTEPLEYTEGENIRWRVINPGFSDHPMHLHGAFYQVLSLGNFESDTSYAAGERQSVVTQDLGPRGTMMLEWTPEHVGRWLFHCHYQAHMSTDERVPVLRHVAALHYDSRDIAPASHEHEESMSGMSDMAGLVLMINVKPSPTAVHQEARASTPHKLDLVIEPTAAAGKLPTFSCSVREGKKIVASEDKSVGPPIVVTRGRPTQITVVNTLSSPTTIHWHGLELDSYYDGVIGGGVGNQVTPAIPPGGTFTAHFTPRRPGTFIYHTHAADPGQLSGGVYGAIIVLEPGESFDPEHDKLLVLGTRDTFFTATRLTLNGMEQPAPMTLTRGAKYRFRLINMGPNLSAEFLFGSKEHPAIWKPLAKDGATVPARLAKPTEASMHIASGETYDFEFEPDTAGEIPLQVTNDYSPAKLVARITVQ
ncbi:MAG TPA: multicopper oxidase domain-containing protein [Terriglobales bacterium]|nr:multicopper oxidase domain-containing protein [Terriglobales bacterium]